MSPARGHRERLVVCACAGPLGDARRDELLVGLLSRAIDWTHLVELVESEGMSGLAWEHLKERNLPDKTRAELAGMRVRQRHLCKFQEDVLGEILAVAEKAGIDVMLLKGSALRRSLYANPEHRSMRDIDLLVRPHDAERLQTALCQTGFEDRDPKTHPIHLPILERHVGALAVGVEVHHVAHAGWRATFDSLQPAASRVEILGHPAWIPSKRDLCRHVYLHAMGADLWLGGKINSIADLVHMAELWGDDLRDGTSLDRRIARAIAWLDAIAPLSDRARAWVGRVPTYSGAGALYAGWPLSKGSLPSQLRSLQTFRATFIPPSWWLRVRFGARPGTFGLLVAWLRHTWNLLEVWWPGSPRHGLIAARRDRA